MKILVTGDFHICERFDLTQIGRLLKFTADEANKRDGLWILGDLFHNSKITPGEIKLFCEFLSSVKVPVTIIGGNHDTDGDSSLVEWISYAYPNVEISVKSMVKDFGKLKILLGHFNVDEAVLGAYDYKLVTGVKADDLDVDLALLGHIHAEQSIINGEAYHYKNMVEQWLCGFLEGAGCIRVDANKPRANLTLQISQKGPEVLEFIKSYLGHAHLKRHINQTWYVYSAGAGVAKRALEIAKNYCVSSRRATQWQDTIELYNSKVALGGSGGKPECRIDHKINTHDLSWPWLAGFFEAEGSIGSYLVNQKYPCIQIRFTQKERQLLEKIQAYLKRHQIESGMSANGEGFNLSIKTRNAERLMIKLYPFLRTSIKLDAVHRVFSKVNALLGSGAMPYSYTSGKAQVVFPGSLFYISYDERNDTKCLVELTVDEVAKRYSIDRIPLDPDPIMQIDLQVDGDYSTLETVPKNSRVKLIMHYIDPALDKKKVIKSLDKYHFKDKKITFFYDVPRAVNKDCGTVETKTLNLAEFLESRVSEEVKKIIFKFISGS